MRRPFPIIVAALLASCAGARDFALTILHTNDLHSHAEPVRIRDKSYGGYARLATLIKQYRKSEPNSILLNAGDQFQGTLYFNVYEGLSDLAFCNAVGFDAMGVGNHEFDKGPEVFADFIRRAKFPVLAANVDVSTDPHLKGLIKPYSIHVIGRQKIGVIGAVTPDLPTISDIGAYLKMKELIESVSASARELTAQKIDKILVVSHCGYAIEKEMAARIAEVDVVVGGHSHSYLANPEFVAPPGYPQPWGPYPTIVKNSKGGMALVLQAWEWGKVFGKLTVNFNGKGEVSGWKDAKPIVVDESIPEDPEVANLIAAFQKPIASVMKQKIGVAEVALERGGILREFIADAMLAATSKSGSVAAFINVGGVRASIESGDVTLGKANEVQPFRNQLVLVELTGAELKAVLETPFLGEEPSGGVLIPSAGTSYSVDLSKPAQSRVLNIIVAGEPWDAAKKYRCTFLNFTANGGDAHFALKAATGYRYDTGILDIDAFVEFIKAQSPIRRSAENRMKLVRASSGDHRKSPN